MIVKTFDSYSQFKALGIDYKLKEDEYFVHIEKYVAKDTGKIYGNIIAFFAKRSKNKTLPKSWLEWRKDTRDKYIYDTSIKKHIEGLIIYETFIWKEEFRKGFEIIDFRQGESAVWINIKTLENFVVEIKINKFIDFIKQIDIKKGIIQNECKLYLEDNKKGLSLIIK